MSRAEIIEQQNITIRRLVDRVNTLQTTLSNYEWVYKLRQQCSVKMRQEEANNLLAYIKEFEPDLMVKTRKEEGKIIITKI